MTDRTPTSAEPTTRPDHAHAEPTTMAASADHEQALLRYMVAISRQHHAPAGTGPGAAAPTRRPAPPGSGAGVDDHRGGRTLVLDVMSSPVVAVREHATFKEIARTLAITRVSAVPVVDENNHVRGVVSQADLLAFAAGDGPRPHQEHSPVAARLMTSPAITVNPETTVGQAGRLAARQRVKRLPVVDGAGRLVGVVSRSDLLRVFLTPDEVIREQVIREVIQRRLCLDPRTVRVSVSGGVVTVTGIRDAGTLSTLRHEALAVDGVVAVVARRAS